MIKLTDVLAYLKLGDLNGVVFAEKASTNPDSFNSLALMINSALDDLNHKLYINLAVKHISVKPDETINLKDAQQVISIYNENNSLIDVHVSGSYSKHSNIVSVEKMGYTKFKFVNLRKEEMFRINYLGEIDKIQMCTDLDDISEVIKQEIDLPSAFLQAICSFTAFKLVQAKNPDVTNKANLYNVNLVNYQNEVQKLINLGYLNTIQFSTNFLFINSGLV